MEQPPKISEMPVKVAPLEVLPPVVAQAAPVATSSDGQPIHALSALILVAVDSLWIPGEFLMPAWIVAIPACFAAVFIPTYLIQRHLKNDSQARALTFATMLAVLAAIPTPITGTPVGLGLLAWTGLGKILGRRPK
jgi:integral membrane sensor domain MASE1